MNPMDHNSEALDRWADSALHQLPAPQAPSSLRNDVLAAIQSRTQLRWYQRPWTQWPSFHRWFSAIAFVLLLIGLFGGVLPLLRTSASSLPMAEKAHLAFDSMAALQSALDRVAPYCRQLVGQFLAPHWFLAAFALLSAWLSTLGLGAACWRVAKQNR